MNPEVIAMAVLALVVILLQHRLQQRLISQNETLQRANLALSSQPPAQQLAQMQELARQEPAPPVPTGRNNRLPLAS